MIVKSSGRWGLSGIVVAMALAGFGAVAQAQTWSTTFTDIGVVYTLSDLTAGSSATQMYALTLDTTGYNHNVIPESYLDSVNFKVWSGNSANMSFALLSAPSPTVEWARTEGPISSGPVGSGCGSSGSAFACVEALDKGVFGVAAGNPYSFLFSVTASSAAAFLTSADGAHVGAGYADRFGSGPSFGITSHTVTTPIPEPETYAMLLAGLGLLALAGRRRKLREAAAA